MLKNLFFRRTTTKIFQDIYKGNLWGGLESVSGRGSDSDQTATLIQELNKLLPRLGISTLTDIPCGDFNWMKKVDLKGIHYTGIDIVHEIININRQKFAKKNIDFIDGDILRNAIPSADIIICRDCLVHLSNKHIWLALTNLSTTNSKYILTTTFPEHKNNIDISTGQWRPLNLEAPPFSLPPPEHVINEKCTESHGLYKDKAMALWETAIIRASLLQNQSIHQ